MPAGKALEQKNSTFVIVILRQIVAKKRAMHFFVNNVSVPALHAPLALISEEKKLAVRRTHVWYTLFENPPAHMVGQNTLPIWTDWVWRNC